MRTSGTRLHRDRKGRAPPQPPRAIVQRSFAERSTTGLLPRRLLDVRCRRSSRRFKISAWQVGARKTLFRSPPPHRTASGSWRGLNIRSIAGTLRALLLAATISSAQDLVPRAYLVTPKGSNAVTLSWSWNSGDVTFDPSVPITDSKGSFQTQVLSYYHSYGLL